MTVWPAQPCTMLCMEHKCLRSKSGTSMGPMWNGCNVCSLLSSEIERVFNYIALVMYKYHEASPIFHFVWFEVVEWVKSFLNFLFFFKFNFLFILLFSFLYIYYLFFILSLLLFSYPYHLPFPISFHILAFLLWT